MTITYAALGGGHYHLEAMPNIDSEISAGPDAPDPAPAEILVAISHVDLVSAVLETEFHIQGTTIDSSELLGLARLGLSGADGDPGPVDVPATLKSLYEYFENQPGKWTPTMGRNRLVGRVVGSGELSFGSDGAPVRAEPPGGWPPPRSGPGRGVKVVVLDTGVSVSGPLSADWVDRYSDISDVQYPAPAAGHATFIAGLILSQAPAATVEVRRVLDDEGQSDAWSVAKAIVQAGRDGADVLNLSLVCYTADGRQPLALAQAINRLDPGTVVVAAAGNNGRADSEISSRPAWPAALAEVVAVGAAFTDGSATPFTPPGAPWIDILAPGFELISTYLTGEVHFTGQSAQPDDVQLESFQGYARWSGTSFAAALVSGAIAAGVEPGRVTALASLARVRERAVQPPSPAGVRPSGAARSAPFIALETYRPAGSGGQA